MVHTGVGVCSDRLSKLVRRARLGLGRVPVGVTLPPALTALELPVECRRPADLRRVATDVASGPACDASSRMPMPSRSHWIAAPVAKIEPSSA